MTKPLAGAVVCEQTRASEIGTEILRQGGNAADAIVATVLAVNVLAPYHSDIGGGGFAIVRQQDGMYTSLDFRHVAPVSAMTPRLEGTMAHEQKAVTMEVFKSGASTAVGGLAVAVPGEIRGLEALHKRYGRLPWGRVLAPAIELARDGMEVRGDLRDVSF